MFSNEDFSSYYGNYPNFLQYAELFEDFSYIELTIAMDAIHDHELADQLFEEESPLLVFLVDSEMQEKLFLFFEDEENATNEYDW